MHQIMTADEITQLLLDRNIIILFNENIPCIEHDETTQLIKKALEAEATEYTWTEYSLRQHNNKNAMENARTFLSQMISLLWDIKYREKLHDQTILCDDGFLGIFTHLFTIKNKIPNLLSTFQYCQGMRRKDALDWIQTAIIGPYSDGLLDYYDPSDAIFSMTELTHMENLISAIFQCGNIQEVTYNPCSYNEIFKYREHYGVPEMSTEAFGSDLFLRDQLRLLLWDNVHYRQNTTQTPISFDSFNNYLRTCSSLFVDPQMFLKDKYGEQQKSENK